MLALGVLIPGRATASSVWSTPLLAKARTAASSSRRRGMPPHRGLDNHPNRVMAAHPTAVQDRWRRVGRWPGKATPVTTREETEWV
jgi:hypothetical protein